MSPTLSTDTQACLPSQSITAFSLFDINIYNRVNYLHLHIFRLSLNKMCFSQKDSTSSVHLLQVQKFFFFFLIRGQALDYILAKEGGVCAMANTTCCTWINISREGGT